MGIREKTVLDRLSQSLETYMDLLVARQKLVSSNIANLDTPGYRTRDLNFQHHLQVALDRNTGAGQANSTAQVVAMPGGVPKVGPVLEEPVMGLTVKNDGNDVSLEREARLLAETAMRFQMASMMLERRLSVTKAAIREEVAR